MKRMHWVVLAGCLGLGGCSAVAPRNGQPTPEPTAAPQGAPAASAASVPAGSEPAVDLNSRLLYQLLVGEVAAQRGELEMSAHAYLQSATATRDPRLARRATQVAVYGHDYTTALKAARLWVELDPQNLEAQQSVAALLIRQGRSDEALGHLEQVLQLAPEGSAEGFMVVTNILAREHDKQRALQVMNTLVAKRAADPNAMFAYANLAYLLEEYDLALQQADKLLAAKPDLPRALVLKANVLRRLDRNAEALAIYQRAVEKSPHDASLRLGYARLLVDEGKLDLAREQFRLLGKQLPGNADVTYAEGLLALQAGDTEQAEMFFKRLLKFGQHENEAAFALGQIAESRNRPDEALKWYEQVTEGNNYLDAAIRAAVIVGKQQGLEAARDYLQQVQPQDSDQALRLRLAEGELLRDAGKFAEATAVYDEALKEFPDNFELLYARAMNAERMDRIDLLERDLRAILKLDPNNVQALNALGYTLADRTKRYREAYDLVQHAYEQRPNDPAIIDSMGWVTYRLGRLKEAEGYLRKALQLQYDPEIAAHLGEVLWQDGRQDEARKVWQDALKRNPDHKVLKQVIERFTR